MIAGKIAWPIGVIITAGDIYDYLNSKDIFDLQNTPEGIKGKMAIDSYEVSDGKEYCTNTPRINMCGAEFGYFKTKIAAANSYKDAIDIHNSGGAPHIMAQCGQNYCFASNNSPTNFVYVAYLGSRNSPCPAGSYVTPEGQCTTKSGKIVDVNQSQIEDKIAQESGWPTSAARALASALNTPGVSVQVEPPAVNGPATVKGETTTTTETVNLQPGTTKEAAPGTTSPTQPGTKTTTKTENTNVKYSGNSITTNNNVTNTTVTITNNVTNETNVEGDKTEEVQDTKEPQEIETCGLPGKPACKIDETGTPDPVEDKAKDDTDKAIKPLDDFIKNPKSSLPELPVINWAFTLPSGCSPISLPAFDPWLQEIDICPFQSIFHDIMSIVWVIGGLFGAISIFWRNTFSQGT